MMDFKLHDIGAGRPAGPSFKINVLAFKLFNKCGLMQV